MIRLAYGFTTKGPLHTGSDVNAGTLRSLRRQKCVLADPIAYRTCLDDAQRRDAVVQIALGVWYAITKDTIKGKRLMGIWDEFANKLIAAGRSANKYQFLENLCRSWGIESVTNPRVLAATDALSDWELLDTVRNESLYVVLKLRALKDAAKEQKDEDGYLTFDLPPITPGEFRDVTRTEDSIPCISGNSFRGRFRRLAMADFCERAGIKTLDKRVYHTLFTGGFLDQSTQFEDFDKMERLVSLCPMLGVLGAAIGNMTIEGEAKVGWAYPICRERGTGEKSYWQYLDTVFQTRSDSSKTEKEIELTGEDQVQQMKYEYEVIADGTPFEHQIACTSTDSLIISAFWHMLSLFDAAPYIGGMGSVGAGEIAPKWELEGSDEYTAHVVSKADEMREFWQTVKI